MFDWIERCLRTGATLPGDDDICEYFQLTSVESARTLLAALSDAGRISIKGFGDTRVITLGRKASAPLPVARPTRAVTKPLLEIDEDEAAARIASIVNRRPPTAAAPIIPTPAKQPSSPAPETKEAPMPQPEPALATAPEYGSPKQINIKPQGELFTAIAAYATMHAVSLGRAALDLIGQAVDRRTAMLAATAGAVIAEEPAPSVGWVGTGDDIATTIHKMVDELATRAAIPDVSSELAAAKVQIATLTEQLESSEARLAQIRQAIGA
ncbi:hypothetical protein [Sphingomonas panaciterrae]|uniref:hypothetical protein n=1 Tax=Sphingomonas panaciterrae TaxID=1462999 RepID=UPI002FF2CB4D